jgi:hypothetical protein
MWRVCAIALSFVSGWRAFSSVSLCKSIIRESPANGLHETHIYSPLRQDKELLDFLNLFDLIQKEGFQYLASAWHPDATLEQGQPSKLSNSGRHDVGCVGHHARHLANWQCLICNVNR